MKYGIWTLALPVALAGCSSDPATSPSDGGAPPALDSGAFGADAATPTPDGGSVVAPDAGAASDAAIAHDAGPVVDTCTSAKATLMKPIDAVSTGEVTTLSEAAGVRVIYVDAAAGGAQAAATSPRLYLNLATAARVAVTDTTAFASADWDLAIKRPVLFTNGGHGGAGQGGAIFLPSADFAAVTAADAAGKTFGVEEFVDDQCAAIVDRTGAVKTTFDGWYDYNEANNQLTPASGTWIVRGPSKRLFKVQILSYYATADGGVGQAGGRYTLKVGAL